MFAYGMELSAKLSMKNYKTCMEMTLVIGITIY